MAWIDREVPLVPTQEAEVVVLDDAAACVLRALPSNALNGLRVAVGNIYASLALSYLSSLEEQYTGDTVPCSHTSTMDFGDLSRHSSVRTV